MRVVQERDGSNNPLVSYTRGNDLSGSMEGAGGIGGLLARSDGYSSGNWTSHAYYFADGNGNITYMLDSSQSIAAGYRYDAFGNTVSTISAPLDNLNHYRFSSKEIDANSGMYYYGYRFYDPNLQRWINRDPIEERGGLNVYAFVRNDCCNRIDRWGMSDTDVAKIINLATAGFFELCDGCMRCDNGLLNQLSWFNPFGKIKGCGQQADFVGSRLVGQKYDDLWDFEIRSGWTDTGLPHQWGVATSSNSDDGYIIFDPWKGIIELHNSAGTLILEMTCKPRGVRMIQLAPFRPKHPPF